MIFPFPGDHVVNILALGHLFRKKSAMPSAHNHGNIGIFLDEFDGFVGIGGLRGQDRDGRHQGPFQFFLDGDKMVLLKGAINNFYLKAGGMELGTEQDQVKRRIIIIVINVLWPDQDDLICH